MLTAADPRTIARYVVEDRLGRGGMGTVYLARDPQLGRQVALKLVQAEFDSAEGRARFEKEARSIAALNHPNIVTVYDIGEFESRPFIVLEYIEGRSLDAVVRDRAPVAIDVRLQWLEELGAGLQFAHDRGIIHRDIKPANLMIDHLGRLRILDFGIARIAGTRSTHMSSMIGTPGYMAPEYVLDLQLDHRADVFAAGAVAYELLTYLPAFPGRTHATIIQKILECSPRRMSDASALVDAELEAVIMGALRKDPDLRYQSAEAFATALRELRLRRDWSSSSAAVAAESARAIADDGRAQDALASTLVAPTVTPHPSSATLIAEAKPDRYLQTLVVDRDESSPSGEMHGAGTGSAAHGRRHGAVAAAFLLVAVVAISAAWLWSGDAAAPTTQTVDRIEPNGGTELPGVDSRPTESNGTVLRERGGAEPGDTARIDTPPRVAVPGATEQGTTVPRAVSTNVGTSGPPAATSDTPLRPVSAASTFFERRNAAGKTAVTDATTPWHAGLRYQIHQLLADNSEVHVGTDTVFKTGDRVRLAFETTSDGYLYVVQEGSSGKWTVLFPNPLINGGRNKVTAFTRHVIPTDRGFRFDGPPGTERIFIAFSKTPVETLPGFDRPVVKVETVDDAVVQQLDGLVRARDLVIEELPFTPDANRDGTYVVNRDEFATAVDASFTLQHK
jgi:predicted Ser/Thr protein kinase